MDKELKDYLDNLKKNINANTDKFGQDIRDVFWLKFDKLEIDLKTLGILKKD